MWTRLSKPGDKCHATWRHASGWIVRHCGHPTANWPYFLEDPNAPGYTIVSFNGYGFQNLAAAKSVVELIVAEKARVTNRHCAPGIACVAGITAFGTRP
jgi:hypothetical protein